MGGGVRVGRAMCACACACVYLAVEERELDTLRVGDGAHRFLALVERPRRRDVARVLARVRVADHHLERTWLLFPCSMFPRVVAGSCTPFRGGSAARDFPTLQQQGHHRLAANRRRRWWHLKLTVCEAGGWMLHLLDSVAKRGKPWHDVHTHTHTPTHPHTHTPTHPHTHTRRRRRPSSSAHRPPACRGGRACTARSRAARRAPRARVRR